MPEISDNDLANYRLLAEEARRILHVDQPAQHVTVEQFQKWISIVIGPILSELP